MGTVYMKFLYFTIRHRLHNMLLESKKKRLSFLFENCHILKPYKLQYEMSINVI